MPELNLDTVSTDPSYRMMLARIFGERTKTVHAPDNGALLIVDPVYENDHTLHFVVLWARGILVQNVKDTSSKPRLGGVFPAAPKPIVYKQICIMANDKKQTFQLFTIGVTFGLTKREWSIWYGNHTQRTSALTMQKWHNNCRYMEICYGANTNPRKVAGLYAKVTDANALYTKSRDPEILGYDTHKESVTQ